MTAAQLVRGPSTNQGTFGTLTFGAQTCGTLELPWRDSERKVSCIPHGRYRCAIVQSPKFGRVYEVQAVPGRSAILIHAANLAGDSEYGWTTELLGCIAPHEQRGTMRVGGLTQAAGLRSRQALQRLMAWAGGRPFDLVISWAAAPT